MSKGALSFTQPLRVRLPDRFRDLPLRTELNPRSVIVNGTSSPSGYSSHNRWKHNFTRFKQPRGPSSGGNFLRKSLKYADAIMLGQAAKRSGNTTKQAKMMLTAGVLEDNRHRFEAAAKYYAKASKLFRKCGDSAAEALSYNFAAISCFEAGDHEKSRLYSRRQRRVHIQNQDMAEDHFMISVNNEGLSFRITGDFEEAEKCHARVFTGSSLPRSNSKSTQMKIESLAQGHLALDMLSQFDITRPLRNGSQLDAQNSGVLNRSIEALQRSQDLASSLHEHESNPRRSQSGRSHEKVMFDSNVSLGVLNLQKGEAVVSQSYFMKANKLARQSQDLSKISATNMYVGVAKGTIQLQKCVATINDRLVSHKMGKSGALKALHGLLQKNRYGQIQQKDYESSKINTHETGWKIQSGGIFQFEENV